MIPLIRAIALAILALLLTGCMRLDYSGPDGRRLTLTHLFEDRSIAEATIGDAHLKGYQAQVNPEARQAAADALHRAADALTATTP